METELTALDPHAVESSEQSTRAHPLDLEFDASSLRRFPVELLKSLFELCVAHDKEGHVLSEDAMVRVLSRTCRRWRMITHSTPSLWQIMQINTMQDYRFKPRAAILYPIYEYFERSSPLPITCHLTLKAGVVCDEQYIRHIISMLSPRLRHLNVECGPAVCLVYSLMQLQCDLPALQSLRVSACDFDLGYSDDEDPEYANMTPLVGVFSTSPHLTDVSMKVGRFQYPQFVLPWSQLKELDMRIRNVQELQFLSDLENMESLSLTLTWYAGCERDWRALAIGGQVEVPRLRYLRIQGIYENITQVLDILQPCVLLDVDISQIRGSRHDGVSDIEADELLGSIAALHRRSSCSLRRLTLPVPVFSSPRAMFIAEDLAAVEELCLWLPFSRCNDKLCVDVLSNLASTSAFQNVKTLHLDIQQGCVKAFEPFALLSAFLGIAEARTGTLEHLSFKLLNHWMGMVVESEYTKTGAKLFRDGRLGA
uniref:Uncharacterized protein n=1 Tax=Moniliophthora roreri TaxID=221103 RepID=A0A0W0EWQ0_MONRR